MGGRGDCRRFSGSNEALQQFRVSGGPRQMRPLRGTQLISDRSRVRKRTIPKQVKSGRRRRGGGEGRLDWWLSRVEVGAYEWVSPKARKRPVGVGDMGKVALLVAGAVCSPSILQ